ncbi:hypothetical protein TPY_3651 [Sulfobacillus acidophilus TPY]|nr:hypothetical protein TPY_3651 [Sulfobacillus acidophilus TPY]
MGHQSTGAYGPPLAAHWLRQQPGVTVIMINPFHMRQLGCRSWADC